MQRSSVIIFTILLLGFGCKKEEVVFANNDIPNYNEIPTITIKNYINRLYIDLIGREPLNSEMDTDIASLKAGDLSVSARIALVDKLTSNTDSLGSEISYKHAYFQKLYSGTKSRLIEGASDDYIEGEIGIFENAALNDSLEGNWENFQENITQAHKLQVIIDSRMGLLNNEITMDEVYRRMMFNSIYDQINMNSFNFVNASFDNLFYRFPTQSEFNNAFNIIENNIPEVIFGQAAINKSDYLNILTSSSEFETGLVHWVYLSLLSREPSPNEAFNAINLYHNNLVVTDIQKEILKTDEYAGFD